MLRAFDDGDFLAAAHVFDLRSVWSVTKADQRCQCLVFHRRVLATGGVRAQVADVGRDRSVAIIAALAYPHDDTGGRKLSIMRTLHAKS